MQIKHNYCFAAPNIRRVIVGWLDFHHIIHMNCKFVNELPLRAVTTSKLKNKNKNSNLLCFLKEFSVKPFYTLQTLCVTFGANFNVIFVMPVGVGLVFGDGIRGAGVV